jgi:Flp pilus assembly protein TadD
MLVLLATMLAACATNPGGSGRHASPSLGKSDDIKASVAAKRSYNAGLNAIRAGDLKTAHKILLGMTRTFPNLAGPHANLGIVYYEQGKAEQAEAAFKRALELNDKRPEIYNRLGILYRSQGRFAEARQAYERALKRDQRYANAHLNLGILYDLYLGNPNLALQHYEQYQASRGNEDRVVKKWISDLRRRTKTVSRTAKSSK